MDRELRRRERRILQSPHEDESLKQLARQYRRSGQWLKAYKIYSSLDLLYGDDPEVQSLVADMVAEQKPKLEDHPRHWRGFPSWAVLRDNSEEISTIQGSGQLLEGVEIPGPIDQNDFRAFIEVPYVSALRLREAHWFRADLSVLSAAKDLESLSVAFINAKNSPLRGLESLKNIKTLDLTCRNLNPDLIAAISSLKALRELSLTVTRGSLQLLTSLRNQSLSHLSIASYHFQGEDCAMLGQLTTLKSLTLEGDLQEEELNSLCQSTSLKKLRLSRVGRKTKLSDYSALGHLTQLNDLCLFNCGIHSRQCEFFSQLTQLQNLTITKNVDINSVVFPHIAQLKSLKGLDLFRTAVGDEQLAALQSLPELQLMFLSSTLVTDQGFRDLQAFPKLEDLFIDKHYSAKDGTLAELFRELN
ncbi:MAG: hypothetical protein P1V97_28520 [Planctomycetota bacterium]|nr:hypothetical protein [Planctomycetota bacterium]